jgi:hypothetical protein
VPATFYAWIVTASYSLTTLQTVTHGNFSTPVPPQSDFPLPYSDDFNGYKNDTLPKYLADQGGSFAVIKSSGDGDGKGQVGGSSSGSNGVLMQMTPVDPGVNGWVANQDPISLVGDLSWTDTVITVMAKVRAGPRADLAFSSGTDNTALLLLPCDATAPSQHWAVDSPYPGYWLNEEAQLCLNQEGCSTDAPIIVYECLGDACGNLEWKLTDLMQLTMKASGQCATANSVGAIHTAACIMPVPPPGQTWSYNETSMLLRNGGPSGALCLSTPLPPPPYVAICSRISAFAAFEGTKANNGVCLRLTQAVQADGAVQLSWSILEGSIKVASGSDLPVAKLGAWHQLSLSVVGGVAKAAIDGVAVGTVSLANTTAFGSASLGSSYDHSAFDNLTIQRQTVA